MTTKLLTLKEIAKILSIPESSLRKYRELFSQFIPGVGKGRSRRYRSEAIEIFKDIRHMREDLQMPWDAITDRLAENYPMDALPAEDAAASPAPEQPAPQQAQAPDPRQQTPPEPAQPAPPQTQASQPQAQTEPEPAQPAPSARRFEPHRETPEPAPPAQQAMDRPAAAPGSAYLRKIAAISEKQMMIVNAMALELMQNVDRMRVEARQEIETMHKDMLETLSTMQRSFGEMSREEKKLLNDVQARISEVRQTLGRVEKSGDRAVKLVEVEAHLKTVSRKLEQREKLIQEYKNSFEVLKRENTELRAFRNRHIDTAEERVREVKGLRKTSLLQRMFGQKS